MRASVIVVLLVLMLSACSVSSTLSTESTAPAKVQAIPYWLPETVNKNNFVVQRVLIAYYEKASVDDTGLGELAGSMYLSFEEDGCIVILIEADKVEGVDEGEEYTGVTFDNPVDSPFEIEGKFIPYEKKVPYEEFMKEILDGLLAET